MPLTPDDGSVVGESTLALLTRKQMVLAVGLATLALAGRTSHPSVLHSFLQGDRAKDHGLSSPPHLHTESMKTEESHPFRGEQKESNLQRADWQYSRLPAALRPCPVPTCLGPWAGGPYLSPSFVSWQGPEVHLESSLL